MSRNDFNNHPYIETIPSEPNETYGLGKTKGVDEVTKAEEKSRTNSLPIETVINSIADPNVTQIGDVDINGHMIIATVGWLVGTRGSCRGIDYRLHSGKNYIGRGDTKYHVNLEKDLTIHRDGPVVEVIYDSKHREFMVGPGNSSVLAYCNNEALYSYRPLKAYDRLEIGESELLFVPLCGSHFSWEDPQK